jgi:hypothetical protein
LFLTVSSHWERLEAGGLKPKKKIVNNLNIV